MALARRFYNDAVRDTVSLRRRRLPRLFRLGGRRPLPAFFEIDDTVPDLRRPAPAAARRPGTVRPPAPADRAGPRPTEDSARD